MSDSPESQPQSLPVVSSSLVLPSSLGSSLAGVVTLPRTSSTASFAPEACHIEDINSVCPHKHQKHSVLHSATHTPGISRDPSRVDVIRGSGLSGKGLHGSDGLPEEDDENKDESLEEDEDEGLLEMKASRSDGHLENIQLDLSVAAAQIDATTATQGGGGGGGGIHSSPPEISRDAESSMAKKQQNTSPTPVTAPREAAATIFTPPAPSNFTGEQESTESNPVPTSEQLAATDDINWRFDNMTELQAHLTGPDSFEQLKVEAPARSSTFPPVPPHDENSTTAHYENEKALFNMMASEVATGDGERGMFDSPSTEQDGFFAVPDDSAEDGFSYNFARSEAVDDNVAAMVGQVLDAAGIGGSAAKASDNVQDKTARFDEVIPLINHNPEDKHDVPDLFSGTEVNVDDDFLGWSGEDNASEGQETFPQLESEKAVEAVYHPTVDMVNSHVLNAESLEPTSNPQFLKLAPAKEEEQEDDFFSKIDQPQVQENPQEPPTEEEDLTARWKAALTGDTLGDDEGFLTSDDEGFLPDSDDEGVSNTIAPVYDVGDALQGLSSPLGNVGFAQTPGPGLVSAAQPQAQVQQSTQQTYGATGWQSQLKQPLQQTPLNPYSPHPPVPSPTTQGYFNQTTAASPYAAAFGQPPKAPGVTAQSFVDNKEGYQSPYDLPVDVAPQLSRKKTSNLWPTVPGSAGIPPSARSGSSMGSTFSPAMPTTGPPKPKPKPQTQKFFEELPLMPPKSKTPSAVGYSSNPTGQALPPKSARGVAPPIEPQRPESTQGIYAQSPQQQFARPVTTSPQQVYSQPLEQQQPNAANSRYSPVPRLIGGYVPPPVPVSAPVGQVYQPPPTAAPNATVPYDSAPTAPPVVPAKYPPRPAGPPQMGNRSSAGTFAPEQPQKTLNFQQPHDDAPLGLRRFPGDHHGMHSSRPGTARSAPMSTATMDVPREEEEIVEESSILQSNGHPTSVPTSNHRYTPLGGPSPSTPGQVSRSRTFSPVSGSPRYSANKSSGMVGSTVDTFSPPPRAQTQSPGMAFGRNNKITQRPREPCERPSSAFAHTSTNPHSSLDTHQRAQSLQMNFMAPTDETGRDVLKRWQGAPLFCWGFGGNVAVMFPRRAHRYTSDGQQPMIKCSPGEVKVKDIKDILPFEEIEGSFPGPAWSGSRNKGKKKEMLPWMTIKIEALEREVGGQGKRAEEKIMLWKVVRLFLEHDGVLEGNPEVEKAVRAILTPEVVTDGENNTNGGHGSFTMVGDISANMQGPGTDRVDPEAVRNIKTNLLKGDRTAAVWHAADKRLWSHALLIAGTVGKDLWRQVVQEFVKHEVKTLGEGVESLAMLYEIFAGNWAESVDELVSASTRVGVPMLGGVPNGVDNVENKLDRWRETLALVLNNRSPGDSEAILALGKLLVSYGRIEAGHICYLFARQGSMGGVGAVMGGHNDPASHFSLLGIDPSNFTPRDVDAVMLSEIYELALSLTPTPHPAFPHLLSYKLHRAMVRAENGHKAEAQKYVDAIEAAMRSWGKPSPYFHAGFIITFEDLKTRLSIAPKDNTSGAAATGAGKWLPKLNSETVTTSVWEAFHTFVNGENDESGPGTDPSGIDHSTVGPFGRISSESPAISRVQSNTDLYGGYNTTTSYGANQSSLMKGFQQPSQPQAPITGYASKYAPQVRNSYESQTSLYDPMVNHQHKSSTDSYTPGAGYVPSSLNGNPGWSGGGYGPPVPSGNPYESSENSHQPNAQQQRNPYDSSRPSSDSTTGFGGNTNTYGSRSSFDEQPSTAPMTGDDSPVTSETPSYGGYKPPSSGGGYEPPSNEFVPFEPEKDDDEKDEEPKPKKKSFMDIDDDDEFLKKAEKVKQEEGKKKAEEKKQVAESSIKKGWLSGWFGKKDQNTQGPIKAKLGEESSFVYDPDLKRWINKKAGEPIPAAAKPAPPPKRPSTPASTSVPSRPGSAAPPPSSTSDTPRAPTPAMTPTTPTTPTPAATPGTPTTLPAPPQPGQSPSPATSAGEALASLSSAAISPQMGAPLGGPPGGKTTRLGPPSRPPTSMSSGGGDAMDDLLGPPGANVSRRSTPGAGRKVRGKSRYVEVAPGQQ